MTSNTESELRFGVIGCGLMGREFASAVGRWMHMNDIGVRPRLIAACDVNRGATEWFARNVASIRQIATDYRELLDNSEIDVIYCAIPHHLHAQVYIDIIEAGKHLLGEKPFGIDLQANRQITECIQKHPNVIVRCASEFPFYPGAFQMVRWLRESRFGTIIDVEAGFWHSSDLDPQKPINWKRQVESNGAYGCMGDLGAHVVHIPLRFGWKPKNVRALLTNLIRQRPNAQGEWVPCETWDNAVLACEVETPEQSFPMLLSTKRIAPGHANTWFLKIHGTAFSAEYNTKNPKEIRYLPYSSGDEQAWRVLDVPHTSAYPTITGPIFEFGFSDSILQMWAAFCDEVAHRFELRQPFYCMTPEEAAQSHQLFTAALESQAHGRTVTLNWSV